MTGRIISAMTCVVLVAAAAPSAALAQRDDESAVVKVLLAIAQYSQEGNLGAMDTLYASGGGVHIIEGAGINHGWEDYRDNHLAPELESFENFQYRYYSIEPQVRGDVAWTAFRYDLSVDTSRGHTEIEGRGTAVLEKTNGRWEIVHMHTSGRPKRGGG